MIVRHGPTRRDSPITVRLSGVWSYSGRVLIDRTPTPTLVDVVRDAFGLARWYVYSDGTMLRPIAGGSEPAPEPAPTPAAVPQDQVNAIVAREAAKAKQQAESDLAATLGVTVEEAKQIVADRKAADDAKKTEAERAAAAAETAKTEAEQLKTEAARERHEAKVERALGKAGLDLDNATLLRAGLAAIDLATGADPGAIKTAVEKLKADAPQLFGTTTTTTTTTDPGRQRRTSEAPSGEFGGRGKSEAERRWGTSA